MTSWRARSSTAAAPLDVALRYLATRPRTEREVRLRLRRAAVEEADVERVLAQLRVHGLLDDAAFARYWVEQRQTFRPRGARLLQAELRQHGISSELASNAAGSVEDSVQEDAYRAAQKRARQLGSTDERTFTTRLSQFLARRGFEWDTIAPTVSRLWAETAQ
ncbi:MAG: RecX family transcriptional regulator [Chloroflexi bacterium]|nr:RecX family transcriptional regulator [Chloroflexota bacterium]